MWAKTAVRRLVTGPAAGARAGEGCRTCFAFDIGEADACRFEARGTSSTNECGLNPGRFLLPEEGELKLDLAALR